MTDKEKNQQEILKEMREIEQKPVKTTSDRDRYLYLGKVLHEKYGVFPRSWINTENQ